VRPAFLVPALLSLAVAGTSRAEQKPGPRASWRAPTAEELADEWRSHDKDRYAVARGDLDGDGKEDTARVMISPDGKRAAIVVELSAKGTKVIALEDDAPDVLGVMGISVIRAGTHKTACGKGYWKCESGEPAVLTLKSDGIDYFKDGSANSVFYLPSGGGEFRRVWLSD